MRPNSPPRCRGKHSTAAILPCRLTAFPHQSNYTGHGHKLRFSCSRWIAKSSGGFGNPLQARRLIKTQFVAALSIYGDAGKCVVSLCRPAAGALTELNSFYQHVYITLWPEVVSNGRAKESQPADVIAAAEVGDVFGWEAEKV